MVWADIFAICGTPEAAFPTDGSGYGYKRHGRRNAAPTLVLAYISVVLAQKRTPFGVLDFYFEATAFFASLPFHHDHVTGATKSDV